MQSICVFLDISGENADASKTQRVCHLIYVFFGCSLDKAYLRQVSLFCDGF